MHKFNQKLQGQVDDLYMPSFAREPQRHALWTHNLLAMDSMQTALMQLVMTTLHNCLGTEAFLLRLTMIPCMADH